MFKLLIVSFFIIAFVFAQDCQISDPDKVDCGWMGINQQQCQAKGCCWVPRRFLRQEFELDDSNDIPWCFYPKGQSPCQNITFTGNTGPGFDSSFYSGMYDLFLANLDIEGKGGVVAAPDNNTPGGSYIYHWMRDAGLSMRSYMEINDFNLSVIQKKMQDYVQWVLRVQNEPDPNGIDIRTEPKFDLPNGEVFTGGWCRPQNDGPGLRSYTLMQYAQQLINAGQINYVRQYLWTGNSSVYNGGAIKFDLDYIVTGWMTQTCDLWEEVRSDNFFWNKMAFKQALDFGAQFAQMMGDSASANTYTTTSSAVLATIYPHWNGYYVQESTNRQLDSAVIHAFVTLNNGVYNFTAHEVAATVNKLNQLFCLTFDINQKDDAKNISGILYGRYQGDTYAGGNPWQLLTGVLGELFYKQAQLMKNRTSVTAQEATDWGYLLNLTSNPTPQEFAQKALAAGDSIYYRMYTHVKDDLHVIFEQMSKTDGHQMSARSLTWSYANILRALHLRAKIAASFESESTEQTQ